MATTIADYLKTAGLELPTTPAAPAKTAAAKPAPVKAAEMPPALAAALAAKNGGEKKEDEKKEDEKDEKKEDKKEAQLTDAQKWLSERGVNVADAKIAEALVDREMKLAEQAKYAELEKMAEEERARGAINYQGQVIEQTALKLAFAQCTLDDAKKIAYAFGVAPAYVVKRAEEMQAAVRSSDPALVGSDLGRAARIDESASYRAAENADQTPVYRPEGVSGTKAPVSGQDEKTRRFTDVWVLPGNPGLDLGQATSDGKGM